MSFIYVFIGGGMGALMRFSIALLMISRNFAPWKGTLIANLLGSFIFFVAIKFIPEGALNSQFLRYGILGGLTTFSTFSYEFMNAFELQEYSTMFLILALNLFGAFLIGNIVFFFFRH